LPGSMTLQLSNLCLRVVLLLVLSFGAGFVECQTTPGLGSLGGSVQDPDGAAVAGAQVALNRPDGSQVAHLVSDGSGSFQFRNVPPGRYVVVVQQTGFRKINLNVVAGGTSRTSRSIRIHTLHSSPDLVGRVSRSPRPGGRPSFMDLPTSFIGTHYSTPGIRSQS
jgi:Carboxypeptidase regulatory-like domain